MIKARWSLILVAVTLLGVVLIAEAQQPAKIPRIGYLTGSSPPTSTTPDLNADAFQQGLRDLGYVEGKNIVVEYRYLEGKADRTASIVAELLQLKVDALVVITRISDSGSQACDQDDSFGHGDQF